MIKIKDIKKSIGTKDVRFEEYVASLLKPKFSGSELASYVQREVGHLPPWDVLVLTKKGVKDGILQGISVSGKVLNIGDENVIMELGLDSRPDADKLLPEAVKGWFKGKGFPEPKSDPEGFVKRLVELYPELSDFVEIS